MAGKQEAWQLDRRTVRVTNLDKPFWTEEGITKGDLLHYYREMAPVLLPYMQQRPFIMRVWPDGIEKAGFYRWRVPKHAPDWLERYTYHLQSADRTAEMAVVDELPELIWVVNQGVIEMHPWFATRHSPDRPTWLAFDLDPIEGGSFTQVLGSAANIRELLDELDLVAMPKTSGGKGLHIFVPIEPRYPFDEIRDWMARFIERLDEAHPETVTADKRMAAREGRILVDYSQNAIGKSIAAPYSVRARPGAPVSTPLSWDEVTAGRIKPADFTLQTIGDRLEEQGDLFRQVLEIEQSLPALD